MPLKDPVARAAYNKQYHKDHSEERNAYQKQYTKDHRDELNTNKKQYNKDHREESKVYNKQYRKDNHEELLAYNKQYNKDHSEERNIKAKQYYKSHREERKQYYKDHPEVSLKSIKKRVTELGKTFNLDYESMMYALMSWSKTVRKRDSNKCTWCNSTQNLVAHHIWQKAYCYESALDVDNGITLCHDCHCEQHRLDKSFS